MSVKYGLDVPISTNFAIKSPIGAKIPNAHPGNCKHECPYGMDRAFCFPCMKKIMEEHRAARRPVAKEA